MLGDVSLQLPFCAKHLNIKPKPYSCAFSFVLSYVACLSIGRLVGFYIMRYNQFSFMTVLILKPTIKGNSLYYKYIAIRAVHVVHYIPQSFLVS